MESLVNEEVKHLKFGRGSILEEPSEHIKVRFQSGGVVKTFRFPDAFAGYLAFEKGELQEKYNEMAMSERRRREEGRREELFKLEEAVSYTHLYGDGETAGDCGRRGD